MGRVSDARERLIQATIDLLRAESYGAASVDAICDRSGVKKGSFYHFFKSKDELVITALQAEWQSRKPRLDALFSPANPPLTRLRDYFDDVLQRQLRMRAELGRIVGCFWSKIGYEVDKSTEIGKTVHDILATYLKYYESALRDAEAAGLRIDDVPGKARALFAFMEGFLSQARINDDPRLIEDLAKSAFAFLGIEADAAA
jgi:TetR/AcrR family transcriptional repressor of nem operon